MDKKSLRQIQKSFEKRGGRFAVAAGAPAHSIVQCLEKLLECPDCRAAVLEACNADNRRDVDIDDVIRGLTLSRHH